MATIILEKYDKDKNMNLDSQEVNALLKDAFKKVGKNEASLALTKDTIKKYDLNRDGMINKMELIKMIKDMLHQ